jgi:hypothetical protein
MSETNKKLAESLQALLDASPDGILKGSDLTRVHQERLKRTGFLQEITPGWFVQTDPTAQAGDTTWLGYYWNFVQRYLDNRFGSDYCLSAEASILLHGSARTIPSQLIVLGPTGTQRPLTLSGNLSLLTYIDKNFETINRVNRNGLQVMSLPEALTRLPEASYRTRTTDVVVALNQVADPSQLLSILLEQERVTAAGRLAGAYRELDKPDFADRIVTTMKNALFNVRVTNPFDKELANIKPIRNETAFEERLRRTWHDMREDVINAFPQELGIATNIDLYLQQVQDSYANDSYNSLSIEGYRVTPELIDRVASSGWNPDTNQADRESRDALAARGYFEAFQSVKSSIQKLLQSQPVAVVRSDHHQWHQALFTSLVNVGLLKPSDLAGYRNDSVFIKGSRHVPPPHEEVPAAMTTLFDLIESEPSAAVRAVLGHFIFVYIHPYTDGNGRLGRFLMNALLATGGYPWTVIPVAKRDTYMSALESASVAGNITPLAEFIANEMQ